MSSGISCSVKERTDFLAIKDCMIWFIAKYLLDVWFQSTKDTYASLKNSVMQSKKGGYVFCYNAPVLVVVANRKGYGNNIADCACAIENMMIAANALDLGSCWINQLKWLNEEPAILEYLRTLGLKEDERVYGSVIIGYPATTDSLPNRKLMPQKGNEVTYIN